MERYANLFFSFSLLFFLLNYYLLVVGMSMASPFQLNNGQINIMVNLSKSLYPDSNDEWNTTDPNPCLWERVTCSSAGPLTVVTRLFLSNLRLSTAANVSDLFSILCRLDTLQYLDLSQNYITTIPDSFFSNCTGLSGLKSLDLSSNELTGPIRNFSNFVSLETLDLSRNSLHGTVETQLSSLSKLKSLDLSSNSLSGTIPTLFIDGRRVAALEELVLSYNQFDDTIPFDLLASPNLEFVDLTSNQLQGPIPTNLSIGLEFLLLGGNLLSGVIPTSIGKLSQLVYLELNNNNLYSEIPSQLGNCSNLSLVNLSSNTLYGELPKEIGNLQILVVLALQMNNLSGEIPIGMLKLERLSTLNLQHNKFYGSIPDSINGLKYLFQLRLGSNYFNGSIPSSLGELRYLEFLDLSYNNFSGIVPVSLSFVHSLRELVLSYNNLSGDLPAFSPSVNVVTVGNKDLTILKGSGFFVVNDSSKRKIMVALVVASSFVAGFSVSFLVSSLTWKFFLIRKKAADVREEDHLSDLNNRKYLQMVQRLRRFHERYYMGQLTTATEAL